MGPAEAVQIFSRKICGKAALNPKLAFTTRRDNAAGFWVENGVIQYPVHEITIAGNLTDMLMNIVAIGAEQEVRGSVQTGSILVENMQVAGE